MVAPRRRLNKGHVGSSGRFGSDVSVDSCDVSLDISQHGTPQHGGGRGSGNGLLTQTERETLARRENRIVAFLKLVVAVVLLSTSFFVSTLVYAYIQRDQKSNFEAAFEADATKLIDAFHQKIQNQIEALDALGVAITSHALATNATFPFVSIPDHAARFANARVMSGSFMVSYNPLVTDANREEWEQYAQDNMHHFEEALAEEGMLQDVQNDLYNASHMTLEMEQHEPIPFIYHVSERGEYVVSPPDSGPYLPVWHMSPVPASKAVMNLDTFKHPTFADPIHQSIQSKMAVMGEASILITPQLNDTGAFFNKLLQRSQFRNDLEEYRNDPMSAFVYPVFDTLHVPTRRTVGGLGSLLYWRLLFKGVLPDKKYTKRGLICVLHNTLNQTLSYRIDNTVTYLGESDRHDHKYSHLNQTSSTTRAILELPMEHKSLTSVALDVQHNGYTLTIYPSSDTEREYVNDDARNATIVILLVFCVTSTVFVLYTIAVAKRQRVVMDRAVASGAIVSSLFPSQVRDQIYQENEVNNQGSGSGSGDKRTSLSTDGTNETPSTIHARPIASVYKETTILFADMVGFTKWSSSREPVKVFELLETLYQAFDAIAVRRRVFKVETIGDCYVAVAGLPDPQDKHAVIMVKFADECMFKMKQLTAELAESLGPDTADLAMRVGLHSGSVTGGVLRGQKSRFQLFGDTMNTASRMESNGLPGRIHVSAETAQELMAKGKAAWISPRADKIVAKGKGELQTYWVSLRSSAPAVAVTARTPSVTSASGGDSDDKEDSLFTI